MPSAPPVLYHGLPSGHGTPCIDVAKIGLHPLALDVGSVAPPYSICVQPPHLASPYGAVPSVDPNRSLQLVCPPGSADPAFMASQQFHAIAGAGWPWGLLGSGAGRTAVAKSGESSIATGNC
jgi:hypothetical protein